MFRVSSVLYLCVNIYVNVVDYIYSHYANLRSNRLKVKTLLMERYSIYSNDIFY